MCSRVAVVLLLAVAGSSIAIADPIVSSTIYQYDVTGATPEELRADLNRHGPFDNEGRRFDGYTRWYVRWRYTYKPAGSGCAIDAVSTNVDIGMTLPRLSADALASEDVKQSFADYVAKLKRFINGYAENAIEAGKQIEAGIAALPPEETCDRMGQVANELGHSRLREANQRDLDYATSTGHGRTHGVIFP